MTNEKMIRDGRQKFINGHIQVDDERWVTGDEQWLMSDLLQGVACMPTVNSQ